MNTQIPERDWKYLRGVQTELLSSLCERVNRRSIEILTSVELSEREKYSTLFHHIENSDKIIAKCFDDWRRSTIWLKVTELDLHNLLTEKHISHLSAETRQRIETVKQLSETKR